MHFSGRKTVAFIANLIPLCTHEYVDGLLCARSLHDGSLIRPMKSEEPFEEDSDEWVTVWWQGDPNRSSDVLAGLLASKLICKFVQLQSVGKSAKQAKDLLEHLAAHYEHKTGQNVFLYTDEDSQFSEIVEGAKRYWPDAVWESLKRTF